MSSDENESQRPLRLLALVAHPADAFNMIGGTLSNHVDAGDEVTLVVTDNREVLNNFRLADDISAGRVAATERTLEAAAAAHVETMFDACRILGIEQIRFLDYDGEWLVHSAQLVGKIASLIQQTRPHLIITHNPLEEGGAGAHAVCGRLVIDAVYLAQGARPGGLSAHHVGQVYFFCPAGETTWLDRQAAGRFEQILVDVTDKVEQKVRAYAQLSAQYIDLPLAAKITEACSGGEAAIHSRVAYAEGFQAWKPEVHAKLPISEHNRKLSEGSWQDALSQLRFIAPYVAGVADDG
jgi:LmbE family N-acetylglucosaminyl deacetylase